jgi:hypothetical protein
MTQHATQRKLMDQLQPIVGWAMERVGDARNYDLAFKDIFADINTYDREEGKSVRGKLHLLQGIVPKLEQWVQHPPVPLGEADYQNINLIHKVVQIEIARIQPRYDYLSRYSADGSAPYRLMTDEGLLWCQPDLPYNVATVGRQGWAYFQALSSRNREEMQEAYFLAGIDKRPWSETMASNLRSVLSDAVLNHYTTRKRGAFLVAEKSLKSKLRLELENDNYKHNTSAYDEYALANAGFLFFFVEPKGSPLRATRFAQDSSGADEGGAARITLPILTSGLLEQGWIMLSDFAQREFPDIWSKEPPNEEQYKSWLVTRDADKSFPVRIRHFENITFPLAEEEILKLQETEKNSMRRQALMNAMAQARGDGLCTQCYGMDLTCRERLLDNILAGQDIIPGLMTRTLLEVARIEQVNPRLAALLATLTGPRLMQCVFKDLCRPQAMIPNGVSLTADNLELG